MESGSLFLPPLPSSKDAFSEHVEPFFLFLQQLTMTNSVPSFWCSLNLFVEFVLQSHMLAPALPGSCLSLNFCKYLKDKGCLTYILSFLQKKDL